MTSGILAAESNVTPSAAKPAVSRWTRASIVSASRRFLAATLRLGLAAGMKVFGDELVDLVL